MPSDNFGIGAMVTGPDGWIPYRPCRHCGVDTLSIREVELAGTGVVAFWLYLCRECMAKSDADMKDRRKVFDDLVAEGMSRETANRVMTRWHSA